MPKARASARGPHAGTAGRDTTGLTSLCHGSLARHRRRPAMPRRGGSVVLAVAVLALMVWPVAACSVPVFRYALERWPADMYRLVVFHRATLTDKQQADVDGLEACGGGDRVAPPLRVFPVDVSGDVPEEFAAAWEVARDAELPGALAPDVGRTPPVRPRAVLMYPTSTMPYGIAWAGSLADAARVVGELSPVRRELARRLVDGQTAVWLLVEKGEDHADTETAKALSGTLKRVENQLRLPHEVDPADSEYDTDFKNAVELRIEFSVLRFSLDDPKEALLVSILRGLLGDKLMESLPVAIPVFGRGRALAVVPREQITEDAIADVCRFLVGPCSCVVKARNPGFDILLPVDWDGLITGMIGADEALPPLSVPAIAPQAITAGHETEVAEYSGLTRNLILMASIALLGLLAATVAVVARKKRGGKRKRVDAQ